jgi:hypothetical protein
MTVTTDTKLNSRSKDPASVLEYFAALPDPRRDHGKIHLLDEIVFMSICAILCGADSWLDIAGYSESKKDWLKTFLILPGGIPSHDTFRRVFCMLDPLAFQVFLRLDDGADGSAWLDYDPARTAGVEAGRHRWKDPAWFGSTYSRSIALAHG